MTHVSVLPHELLDLLAPQPGETWVDATVGAGGHLRMLATAVGSAGRVIGFDQDGGMITAVRSQPLADTVTLVRANFDQLAAVLRSENLIRIDGLVADLGFCSDQMEDPLRGLSFQTDGPLDMRLDPEASQTAADIVAQWSERDLADLFWMYGEERHSRRVAARIAKQRETEPIDTTAKLAELVRRCVPRDRKSRIDPATRVFQSLRIAVNDEIGSLERLLAQLPAVIRPGGRVGIISFHSLEDRCVKRAFQDREVWETLTKKPVQAGEAEMAANPRARSAKLRTARRRSWLTEPTI